MNPCSQRDKTFSAGALLAVQMIDWTVPFDGWRYSTNSGAMIFVGRCS